MMDTVLNIGLNETTVAALARHSGNERFAWDSYRRFVQMYGDVVLDMKPTGKHEIDPFEQILEDVKMGTESRARYGIERREDLKEVVARFTSRRQGADGTRLSQRPGRAALGGDSRRFRELDERSGDRLPAPVQHSPRMGHRLQHRCDGLR